MDNLRLQGFEPNDLPVFDTKSDRPSPRLMERTSQTTSFSQALERASARETRKQVDSPRQQSSVKQDRTKSISPVQKRDNDQSTPVATIKEHRVEKTPGKDQHPATSVQNVSQAAGEPAAQTTAGTAAQQASAAQAAGSDEPAKSEATVTISLTGSGDDVKVSLHGLPEELLTALLSALQNGSIPAAPSVTLAIASETAGGQAVKSALDEGQAVKSALDEGDLESLPDGAVNLTVKTAQDPADPLKGMNEILSLIQALTNALQNSASSKVQPQPGEAPITGLKASDLLEHLLPKEASVTGASPKQGPTADFKDLISESGKQTAQGTTTGSVDLNGLNIVPDGASELKLRQGADLTESLLSKMKVTVSLPGVVEAANVAGEKAAELPSEGNGNSSLSGQGASMQADMQRQAPLVETSNTTSFGSIVADRIAAVAEQVGLREKPLDITLRLSMENGESLVVGLKDQAGKIIVQVRSADQNLVSLLESQKETIVRHLEAKQISSSISIIPIAEDLAKRQGREQPKNTWGRRRQPADPFKETT